MEPINRRNFLKSTGMAAGIAAGPLLKMAKASLNDTINIAVVGIHGRGQNHYGNFAKLPNVRVATLVDVDERLFPAALRKLGNVVDYKVKTETDLRRVLDDKEIHAISVATPDHWHALATIWGCRRARMFMWRSQSHIPFRKAAG